MNKVMAMPEVRARLEKIGGTPFSNSCAEYDAQIRSEIEAMGNLAKARNISLEE